MDWFDLATGFLDIVTSGLLNPSAASRHVDRQLWVSSRDPVALLGMSRAPRDPRKLRLFACGCCRQFWNDFGDRQQLVVVAERWADGLTDEEELASARAAAAVRRVGDDLNLLDRAMGGLFASDAHAAAVRTGERLLAWADFRAGQGRGNLAGELVERDGQVRPASESARPRIRRLFCNLLRDLVGDPEVLAAVNPSWRSSDVMRIAQARMLVLADALEEAGCDNAMVLDHCREPGDHIRGCWVVDALCRRE